MAEIPTEALEAAKRASDAHQITVGGGAHNWNGAFCLCGWESGVGMMTQQRAADEGWDHTFAEILAAAAPFLIAQGRRQAAEAIRRLDVQRIADLEGDTVRVGLTVAARIAEGLTPAERAERQLRESRERQAGLMDRIERARDAAEARSRRSGVLGAAWAARIEEGTHE
jgi:hypothetical protein